jgi:uncharacterized repeat protein (TIGR03803 family)
MVKKIYPLLFTLLCLLFYVSNTQAQKRIWGTFSGGVYHIKVDGSEFVRALDAPVDDPFFGGWEQSLIQKSDGSIVVIGDDAATTSGGAIYKFNASGIDKLHVWDYPGADYVVEDNSGNLVGVGIIAVPDYGFKFNISPGGVYSENNFALDQFSATGGLIKASNGLIYGLNVENPGARGYIYRVDAAGVTRVRYLSTAVGRQADAKFIEGNDGYLYAPAKEGGSFGHGTVFRMSLDASRLNSIYQFDGANGSKPFGELAIDASGFLYGMTEAGGLYNKGVIYKVNKNGTGFMVLHHFNGESGGGYFVRDGNILYGHGYNNDYSGGFLFSIHTDGTSYGHLYNFPITSTGNIPLDRLLIVETPPVPAVALVTPANGATGVAVSGTFSSNTIDHARSYQLQLSLTSSFTSIDLTVNSSTNNFSVSGLSPSTTYYARVKTNVLPGYGATTSFTTGRGVKKLWGVLTGYPGKIYNINLSGSGFTDYFAPAEGDLRGTDPQNLFKLNDGSILAVMYEGGASTSGTLLKINSSGLTKLVDWESYPFGRRVYMAEANDGFIYGVGISATENSGRAFKLRPDGTGYSYHVFNHYGFWPDGSLLKGSNGSIYGMSAGNGPGWIYTVNTDLTNVTSIFTFSSATGKKPEGGLIEVGGYLYGVAKEGGAFNKGTIFKIKLDATGFVKLHDFNGTLGRIPIGDLLYDGVNTLYGITRFGGSADLGTLYKMNLDGSGFMVLHHFDATVFNPSENLVLDGGILYGHAQGGTFGSGVLFSIHTDGTSYTNIYNFPSSSSYYAAVGNLIITDGVFPAPARRSVENEIVQSTIGVEQDNNAHISPNPFTHDFSVEVKSHREEPVSFSISSIQGATVLSSQGVSNQVHQLGDGLSSGVYILKVEKDKKVSYYRIIKK